MEATLFISQPIMLESVDMAHIERALTQDFAGATLSEVLHGASEGTNQIWVFRARDAHGTIVTMVNEMPVGKELYVWLISGKGMFPHRHFILERLEAFARHQKCLWLRGLANEPFAHLLERAFDFKRHSVCMIKGVPDGRE